MKEPNYKVYGGICVIILIVGSTGLAFYAHWIAGVVAILFWAAIGAKAAYSLDDEIECKK